MDINVIIQKSTHACTNQKEVAMLTRIALVAFNMIKSLILPMAGWACRPTGMEKTPKTTFQQNLFPSLRAKELTVFLRVEVYPEFLAQIFLIL